jgi:hypothetical protein
MNHSENDSKQLIYNERKAFVQKMWSRYSHTLDEKGGNGDYRLLAEICEKLPFFEQNEVGKEISRILKLHCKVD